MPIFALSDAFVFPPAHLASPEGLLAVGGDLSPQRILKAYKNGIFPWYSDDGPILWWSPDPRMILLPGKFKVSKSLKRTMSANRFEVSMDRSFERVIGQCARIRTDKGQGTWITGDMEAAYVRLHAMGYAHSVEIWLDEKLVGGLYGLSLGRCFFGESMFSRVRDASKVGLYHLCRHLEAKRFELIDCQVPSEHLKSLGATAVSRKSFLLMLKKSLRHPTLLGNWTAV